jgi:hypothetical protein
VFVTVDPGTAVLRDGDRIPKRCCRPGEGEPGFRTDAAVPRLFYCARAPETVIEELPVHVSREEIHSLDVPASFETGESFDVVFLNHGESVHVHLHLDDTLSEFAHIDASNHFVEGGSERAVRVYVEADVVPDERVLGKLKLVTGYGARTRWVDIELVSPDEGTSDVRVDESLAKPPAPETPETGRSILGRPEVPVLGLGALALVVAGLAVVLVGEPVVVLGSLVVLAGVLTAVYVLFGR